MKVLQICLRVPYPPKDGGAVAMNNLTEGLIQNGVDTMVLAINTDKHFVNISELPIAYIEKTRLKAVRVDTNLKWYGALMNIFSNDSYNISRFYSEDFNQLLLKTLKENEFDIIQLESLFTTPYISTIRKNTKAKIVLRTHNVEHVIWQKLSEGTTNTIKKWYLKFLAKRLYQYEIQALKKCDALVNITETDTAYFKKYYTSDKMLTIPFGVNIEKYNSLKKDNSDKNLFHLGALDWMPNQQGLMWFLKNCWSKLNRLYPDLKFYIAGRNIPDWFKNLNYPNVIIKGEVKDAVSFMNDHAIMIVPLFSGSGMRTKIIEGMALGKVIVSTSIGVSGIEAEHGKNFVVADSAEEFVASISKCINDQHFVSTLSENSMECIKKNYDNQQLCNKLVNFYSQLLTV